MDRPRQHASPISRLLVRGASTRRLAGLLRTLLPDAQHMTLPGMGLIAHAPLVNDRLLRFLGVEATLHGHSHRSPVHPEVRPDVSTTPDYEYEP